MMAKVTGLVDVQRFIRELPAQLERKVLRGALRAAADVVAEEARMRCASREVAGAIKVTTGSTGKRIVAEVIVKGKAAYIAPWLEYGTDPHFISVDQSQRDGRTIARINRQRRDAGDKEGSLVINGNFVGETVFHPGARPHPFMRPALDTKEGEAVAAAQAYINARVSRAGIVGVDEGDAE
jgi:hypothetical protein